VKKSLMHPFQGVSNPFSLKGIFARPQRIFL
jgi:hypothetical protein